MENIKAWFARAWVKIVAALKSKTVWFNLITAIVAVGSEILGHRWLSDPAAITVFSSVVAVGNIVLRVFFTTTSVDEK